MVRQHGSKFCSDIFSMFLVCQMFPRFWLGIFSKRDFFFCNFDLVHIVHHCIGVSVSVDYMDVWAPENSHGKRFRSNEVCQLVDILQSFSPFLFVTKSREHQAQEQLVEALQSRAYNKKAGVPIQFPRELMRQLQTEIKTIDLKTCRDEDKRWRCNFCANRHFRLFQDLVKHHKYHIANPFVGGSNSRQGMIILSIAKLDKMRENILTLVGGQPVDNGRYLHRSAQIIRTQIGAEKLKNSNEQELHVHSCISKPSDSVVNLLKNVCSSWFAPLSWFQFVGSN